MFQNINILILNQKGFFFLGGGGGGGGEGVKGRGLTILRYFLVI